MRDYLIIKNKLTNKIKKSDFQKEIENDVKRLNEIYDKIETNPTELFKCKECKDKGYTFIKGIGVCTCFKCLGYDLK